MPNMLSFITVLVGAGWGEWQVGVRGRDSAPRVGTKTTSRHWSMTNYPEPSLPR